MALAILFKPQPRSGTVMYSVRRVSMAICTQRNPKPVLLAFIAAAIVFAPASKKDFMALGRFPLLAFVASFSVFKLLCNAAPIIIGEILKQLANKSL